MPFFGKLLFAQNGGRWKIYSTIREIEVPLLILKASLGIRPIFHKTDENTMAQLLLEVLAYQLESAIRFRLIANEIRYNGLLIIRIMNMQEGVTFAMHD